MILRLADGSAGPRAWLVFGLLAGLGIENKHSTVFFLVALLVGVLLSPQRRLLWSNGCAAAVAVLVLIAVPNFLWQWTHHFPTYEFLNNVAHSDKNIKLPPLAFLKQQINMLLIAAAPLWICGLAWLAIARTARTWRFVAFTYLVFLALMMAMHAKDYYVAPIYPVLFAAGAVFHVRLTRRNWTALAYAATLAVFFCCISAPIMLTLLPPEQYVAFAARLGASKTQSLKFTSPLPEFLSDRFGWPEMVSGFATRYKALSPAERAQTAIFCGNYGEASAVNILGPKYGLPTAISGNQNYFYLGPNGYTGASVLTLGSKRENYTQTFDEVIDLGTFDAPWTLDLEHQHYFWLRHRKRPYAADWEKFKFWY